MSRDWTPAELQAASTAMKAEGHMSYEEFCADLERKAKTVKVTFGNGDVITTRMNATEETVRAYYKVGSQMNIGAVHDDFETIVSVDIVDSGGNAPVSPGVELQQPLNREGV